MSKKYKVLALVISVSLGVTFYAPIDQIFRNIASLPAAVSLCLILVQFVRDEAAHVKNKEILQQKQIHNLGSASHMANTVFDKQVEFAEKYSNEVIQAFNALRKTTDSEAAYGYARTLTLLRLDYMCWLTDKIDNNLSVFESKLRTLGSNSMYLKCPKGDGTNEEHRDQAAVEMLEIQAAFTSLFDPNENQPDATLNSLANKLRTMLSVEQLVEIKNTIINQSINGSKIC